MRMAIVVVGIVLLVIGAVLMFVPVVDQGSQTVSSTSAVPGEVVSVSGFSLTGSIPVTITWTADSSVEVAAATCSGSCENANVSQVSGVTLQTGTSGTINLNQPDGGEVGVFVVSASGHAANATFDIKTALTSVGSILIVLGIVLLIVGIVLKAKPKGGAAPMVAPPMADPGTMDSPPPSA
ncbi:MAG: hypothetical protein L3K00_02510 [Thermoplasmata archaeon]|nr:hypothetical protein [Thermoplasmata archaeon]